MLPDKAHLHNACAERELRSGWSAAAEASRIPPFPSCFLAEPRTRRRFNCFLRNNASNSIEISPTNPMELLNSQVSGGHYKDRARHDRLPRQ
jgi:hypothetical protein